MSAPLVLVGAAGLLAGAAVGFAIGARRTVEAAACAIELVLHDDDEKAAAIWRRAFGMPHHAALAVICKRRSARERRLREAAVEGRSET